MQIFRLSTKMNFHIYICIHPYKSRCIKHIILHFETMASNIPFSLFKSTHEEDIFTYTSYIVVIISYCYHLDGDFIDDFIHLNASIFKLKFYSCWEKFLKS